MRILPRVMFAAAAAGSLAFSVPAMGQQAGLVNVDLSNILNNNDVRVRLQDILSHNNVNVQIPANVNVPIGLAANICGVSVLSLKNDANCDASTDISQGHMQALANAIQRQAANQ